MLRVGLTGGIGSGKSTVANLFAQHGAPIIDADVIARRLVTPGQPGYHEVIYAFGQEIVAANEEIDRARLRARVFDNETARKRLEAILHPRIRSAMLAEAAQSTAPYCLLVAPLLIESGLHRDVDRVLVIDVTAAIQVERVMARSGLSAEEVRKIMATQLDREQRLTYADDVIVNDGGMEQLEAAVARLHAAYRQTAGA